MRAVFVISRRSLLAISLAAASIAPASANPPAMGASASCFVSSGEARLRYSPIGHAAAESIVAVTVHCRGSGTVAIAVGAAPGASGTFAMREMHRSGGGDTLRYNVYYDGGVFGDGTSGTTRFAHTLLLGGDEHTDTFLLHVVAPADQDVSVGNYHDSLTLSVEY